MVIIILIAILFAIVYHGKLHQIMTNLGRIVLVGLAVLLVCSSCTKSAHADEAGVVAICSQVGTAYQLAQDMHYAKFTPQQTTERIDRFHILSHSTVVSIVNQVYFDNTFYGVDSHVVGNAMRNDCMSRLQSNSYTPAQ